MSEPMSSGEIEDVLSSIRRLVSEELRPMTRGSRPEPDGKLMLTPALRVVANEPADLAPTVPDTAEGPEIVVSPASVAPAFLATPWVSDADEESDVTHIEGFVFQSRQPAAIADPFKSLPMVDTDVESDAPDLHVLQPEVLPATDHHEPAAWDQEAPSDESEIVYAQDAALEQADVDALVEPDPDWILQAEAAVMASLSLQGADIGAGADTQGTQASDFSAATSSIELDEAVLRDLVRDLIREELQGSLGERITRNVRKLVRIEVARALSLHDLE